MLNILGKSTISGYLRSLPSASSNSHRHHTLTCIGKQSRYLVSTNLLLLRSPRHISSLIFYRTSTNVNVNSRSQCYQKYSTGPKPSSSSFNNNNGKNNKNQEEAKDNTENDESNIRWYWIPASVGLSVIAIQHLYKTYQKEKQRQLDIQSPVHNTIPGGDKNDKIILTGPWQVHVLAALPLKTMSRLFGYFNELTIPVTLRKPLLGFYAWLFGCNLEEMKDPDLRNYPNLSTFFYRELKEDVRPIADMNDPASLVSPSDGRILHFGVVEQRRVEQVKGLTYNLDSFFGLENNKINQQDDGDGDDKEDQEYDYKIRSQSTLRLAESSQSDSAVSDMEFANVNGIPYSVDSLLGNNSNNEQENQDQSQSSDNKSKLQQERSSSLGSVLVSALKDLGTRIKPNNKLFFCVIYLAPGDYHRFHSPANWVVEGRRHFAGELYSVSPYIASILPNLFVLNERVVLLGRWKYGFMSMVPVGATNVGSIQINFDKDLKTNTNDIKEIQHQNFTETVYKDHSYILGGVRLHKGQEVGGFKLGSTVVLVFEAPESFKFAVETNQYVRMGEYLGGTKQ
ncbi:phosphatidylserine decarboxylase 1 [Mycoemilia scoparia]|uniref:Phosphatidylserine decarboxylase proenzyme 1, mitochondrial n=1 Tax=Mycoemilia scoparia TaxID=417184 RepID=A0A9W7ZYW4_9FUNG|nr:phosphatidylserine decarboxylase 1 [Mycoemilia scoparia]